MRRRTDMSVIWRHLHVSDVGISPLISLSFQCQSCRKTWPSARATVVFRYRLLRGRGTIIMRPFGQACRRCQDDERYYLPGFSKEEVERALSRLFSKIGKNCYGEEDDSSPMASAKVMTKPHERTLCEACAQGICNQDDNWARVALLFSHDLFPKYFIMYVC